MNRITDLRAGTDRRLPTLLGQWQSWKSMLFLALVLVPVALLVGWTVPYFGIWPFIGLVVMLLPFVWTKQAALLIPLLVCTAPTLAYAPQLAISTGLVDIRADYWLAFGCLIVLITKNRKLARRSTYLDFPVGLLVVSVLLSTFYAYFGTIPPSLAMTIRILEGWLLFFFVTRFLDYRDLPSLARWLILLAVATALLIVVLLFTRNYELFTLAIAPAEEMGDYRWAVYLFQGYLNPQMYLLNAEPLITFGFALCLSLALGKRNRWLFLVIALFLVIRTFTMGVRSGPINYALITFVVMTVSSLKGAGKQKRFGQVLMIVCVIALGLAVGLSVLRSAGLMSAIEEKFGRFGNDLNAGVVDASFGGRLSESGRAWARISRSPITLALGLGTGAYGLEDLTDAIGVAGIAHLWGVFGVFAATLFLVRAFRQAWRLIQLPGLAALEMAWLTAQLGFLTYVVFSSAFNLPFAIDPAAVVPLGIVVGATQVIAGSLGKRLGFDSCRLPQGTERAG